jgi:hypothetical protein
MTATRTQADMYYNAVRNLCERDETFMELICGGLTRQELAVNIERRPSLWSRYARYFRTLPSSPMRDPVSLLLGENDQHREIIDRMIDVIENQGLEILQLHPVHVVVYHRQRLPKIAYPGANLLWMVNDTESVLFLMDVHPDENQEAKKYLACGADFICYHIRIGGAAVAFAKITPEEASALCDAVPEFTGTPSLCGTSDETDCSNIQIAHHELKIATLKISSKDGQTPVTIIPEYILSQAECGATQMWAEKYQVHHADTIFAQGDITWKDARYTTEYIVVNEHTLGYRNPAIPSLVGVLAGNIFKGGADWKNGPIAVLPTGDCSPA